MNTWSANALGAQCIIFGNPDSFDNHSFVEYSSHHNITIFPWNHFHENFCELHFTEKNPIKCTYTGKKIYYRRIFLNTIVTDQFHFTTWLTGIFFSTIVIIFFLVKTSELVHIFNIVDRFEFFLLRNLINSETQKHRYRRNA